MMSTPHQRQAAYDSPEDRTSYSRFTWMLALAAVLPLVFGVGAAAGLVLSVMLLYVLLVRPDFRQNLILWLLVGIVLIENVVFTVALLS